MRTPSLLIAIITLASVASAAPLRATVVVRDGGQLSDEQRRRLEQAGTAALKRLSGFETFHTDATTAQPCADEGCELGAAKETLADEAFVLSAALPDLALHLTGAFVDVDSGKVLHATGQVRDPDAPNDDVLALARKLLPSWALKGYAQVAVKEPDAQLKIDGRPVKLEGGTPLAVPTGEHELELNLPSGEALLYPRQLRDQDRTLLEVSELRPAGAARATSGLRRWSYVFVTAGALAISGAFVAAGLGRQQARDYRPCAASDRSCPTLAQALVAHARAERYTTTANRLLEVGAPLALVGAGLFTFDLVSAR